MLRDLVAQQAKVIATPYPDLSSPVVVSAWGRQLALDSADDPRLAQFIATYRNSADAPEPAAACQGAAAAGGGVTHRLSAGAGTPGQPDHPPRVRADPAGSEGQRVIAAPASVEQRSVAEDVDPIGAHAVPQHQQQVGRRAPHGHVALGVRPLDPQAVGAQGDQPLAAAHLRDVGVGGVQVDGLAGAPEVPGAPPRDQHGQQLVDGVDRQSEVHGVGSPTADWASTRCTAASTAMRRGQKLAGCSPAQLATRASAPGRGPGTLGDGPAACTGRVEGRDQLGQAGARRVGHRGAGRRPVELDGGARRHPPRCPPLHPADVTDEPLAGPSGHAGTGRSSADVPVAMSSSVSDRARPGGKHGPSPHLGPESRAMIVDCAVLYTGGQRQPGQLHIDDAVEACRRGDDTFVWIGLHEPTPGEFDAVAAEFELHPLAIEDAVNGPPAVQA